MHSLLLLTCQRAHVPRMNVKTVLISGVGIGGPTLAFWLRAAGFEPTLIERAPGLRAGGFVIDFWGLGYDLAERMGLANDIERAGYHMRELRIVDDRGERVAAFGTTVFRELTGGRFVTLGRSDLSRLLFAKIRSGTEVIFGDEILGLQQHADRVQVQFKHGNERSFDLVIGADGLHSGVRRLVFGSQDRFEGPRDEDVYVIHSEPGRMLGRFALHDDRTLFLFVFAADVDRSPTMLDLPTQKALLRKMFGDGKWECARILGELDSTQALYFDRVSQVKMETWWRGRVGLVGDAAFCVSLMAGQGSALAMTSAYVLAGELAKAIWAVRRSVSQLRNALARLYQLETEGGRTFFRRLSAKDLLGAVSAQSSDKGLCHSRTGKAHVRAGYC
jgi:2-polyprenyl-6-methoxyphenol hydroxylase-like FAD-dependent oxidoreductase